MKYAIVILMLFVSYCLVFATNPGESPAYTAKRDTVPTGAAPQLFGGKLYEFRNYVLIDSFLMVMGGDTFAIPRWPAIKFKTSDRHWYGHDNTRWQRFTYATDSGVNQNLQQVTDIGNKTTDTIITTGIRTNNIIADTLNDPDFEIMVLPDLQYQTMTGTPANCTIPDSGLVGNTFNWIAANKTTTNLQAVLQVGDLTDDGNVSQFARVDSNYDKFDNHSIRYLYVPGNHDYAGGSPTDSRVLTEYNNKMGPTRYTGQTYYGGNYDGTNSNYYITFDVGRRKFLVIGLEFQPRDAVLTWAQGIMNANTDRETIVVTHALVTGWGEKAQDSSGAMSYGLTDNNNGVEIWNKLIRKNKQIIMTLNGHFNRCCGGGCQSLLLTSLGDPVDLRLTQTGDYGNIVHMLAYNHQNDSLGGAGHIMRLKFKPSANKIDVSFFNARYQGNDPRRPSYSLYYPPVIVDGSMGVKGNFDVAGEATFDSSLKITTLPKYRPVITGINGTLDSIAAADSAYVFVSQGVNKPPKYDTLPGNSNAYIKNQIAAQQVARFWTGPSVMGTVPSYQATLGGAPLAGVVTQGNGNFGFCIQRAGGANISPPHLSFYHHYGSSFTGTPIPVGVGAELGSINFFGVALDSSIFRSMYIRGRVQTVGANYVSSALRIDGTDNAGVTRTRLFIDPDGNMSLGGTTANTYRLEVTNAIYGNDSVRFSRLSGSGDVLSGTNNVGSFKKVIVGAGLSLNATGDTLSTSASGMAIGNTITSATEGSVLFAGPSGVLAQNNANFFWDNTNNRLGIGTPAPGAKLHVNGSVRFDLGSDANYDIYYRNSSADFTRLAAGADGSVLTTHSTTSAPTWETPSPGGIYGGSGSLPSDVTVSTAGNTLTVTGSNNSETSFSVANTGTTNASAILGSATGTTSVGVTGTSSSYIGVYGISTSNIGILGQSSSSIGVTGSSSTGVAFRGQINPSSTNAVENIITLLRTSSSGAGANGLGAAIQYELETATSGNSQTAGSLAYAWSDATSATRTSQFEVFCVNSGVTQKNLTVKGAGQLQFNSGYGTNAHTGTATTVAQFDASGNVIEGPINLTNTATLDFGSTAAGTSTDLTITVTGAAVGDAVVIGVPNGSMPSTGTFMGWVSATNTVSIRFANNDLLVAMDPASGTFRATVLK